MERQRTCDEYCRFAQHCFKKELHTADNDPDKCIEYLKLEDYEWDALCGEKYDREYEPDDEDEEGG